MGDRTLYGLRSSADRVIRYIGSTTRGLHGRTGRLYEHLHTYTTTAPVSDWLVEVAAAGHRVEIVEIATRATVADEMAEIASRVAAGEPLLNVVGGSAAPNLRLRSDLNRHSRPAPVGDSTAAPEWTSHLDDPHGRSESPWRLISDARKPIRPREPLHPTAWAAKKQAEKQARQQVARAVREVA